VKELWLKDFLKCKFAHHNIDSLVLLI